MVATLAVSRGLAPTHALDLNKVKPEARSSDTITIELS